MPSASFQAKPSRPRNAVPLRVPPDEYAAFIGQIALSEVWLQTAEVTNYHGPHMPEKAAVRVTGQDARRETRAGGFNAFHSYRVRIEEAGEPRAEINVTFGLQFDSQLPLTDQIFSVFEEINLPVNTWPYLREFVANTLGRMNWQPFSLPALKRGTESVRRPAKARSARPARPRRPTEPESA